MGKRTGAVIVSALFVIFLVAVFGIPTSVESVYPTPTPTPPVGSCTGIADCNVNPGGCGGSCDACESYSTTTCYSASGVPTVCNQGCSNNTACVRPDGSYCSTPPAGCPSDRSVPECSWSGANDCGGGVCGCGERRSGTLWCDGQHCDDICTSDQACIAGCNGPTPTPGVPTPTPPSCQEYCSPSCACDCYSLSCSGGVCKPEPYCSPSCTCGCSSLSCNGGVCNPGPPCAPGIIQARAMVVTKPNTSCDDVKNSTTTLTGTVTHQFTLSSASQPTQVQSGNSYTVFNNVIPGSYTIDSQVPAQYVLARACWTSILDTPSSGESKFHELTPADTLTWDLGYTSGVAWSQVQGGDVYAGATLKSYVPAPHPTPPPPSTRVFILNGDSGYPGVATYGTDYNFDSSGLTHGETWVSSKNWLVNDTAPATDFYQLMYRQFGGAPATVDYVNPVSPIAQPPPRATPYYVTGNMTTSGDWLVGAGSIHVERIIKT